MFLASAEVAIYRQEVGDEKEIRVQADSCNDTAPAQPLVSGRLMLIPTLWGGGVGASQTEEEADLPCSGPSTASDPDKCPQREELLSSPPHSL